MVNVSDPYTVDEDLFRWLMERQNTIYATLLGAAQCYLDMKGLPSKHLLAPMVAHESSAILSDEEIAARLTEMIAKERKHSMARADGRESRRVHTRR